MEEYKRKSYKYDAKKQREYWDTAIGLQDVDGLKPSEYLYELSNQNVEGDITTAEVEERLNAYYKANETAKNAGTMECDIVSTRIVELLAQSTVSLNPSALKSIHRYLFNGIYDFAGRFRDYNITKDEPVLNGDTVKYANYFEITDILEYDFNVERQQKYSAMTRERIVKRICAFTSSIWQVHPFGEGNTRTTAVFTELYLNSIGFTVNNDMFKEYAKYYRNAMVRSNYADYGRGIDADFSFLEKFYFNLLFNEGFELNDDMTVGMK